MNGLKQQTEVAAVVWDGAPSPHELVRGVGMPLMASLQSRAQSGGAFGIEKRVPEPEVAAVEGT